MGYTCLSQEEFPITRRTNQNTKGAQKPSIALPPSRLKKPGHTLAEANNAISNVFKIPVNHVSVKTATVCGNNSSKSNRGAILHTKQAHTVKVNALLPNSLVPKESAKKGSTVGKRQFKKCTKRRYEHKHHIYA